MCVLICIKNNDMINVCIFQIYQGKNIYAHKLAQSYIDQSKVLNNISILYNFILRTKNIKNIAFAFNK